MQNNVLARFATPASVPVIPERSLAKYIAAPPAQAIDAEPRHSQARVTQAPLVADPARSERGFQNAWGWAQDPALLVGVGVCLVVWLASTKLMRR